MKGGIVAAVAAMAGGAVANNVHHRHAHDLFANKRGAEHDLCTTYWSTIIGEPTRTQRICPAEDWHSESGTDMMI